MKLIIGFGNPEERYTATRHNVGFRMLDEYAAEKNAQFQLKEKFRAQLAEFTVDGERVILAKPITYYNSSGETAHLISNFYKVDAADILIVHDELALPFGTIRTRIGGSDAGNNGVKSVTEHLGPDTTRLRIGVYNELRDKIDDADFVLSKFTADEAKYLNELYKKTTLIIDNFLAGKLDPTTHK